MIVDRRQMRHEIASILSKFTQHKEPDAEVAIEVGEADEADEANESEVEK